MVSIERAPQGAFRILAALEITLSNIHESYSKYNFCDSYLWKAKSSSKQCVHSVGAM